MGAAYSSLGRTKFLYATPDILQKEMSKDNTLFFSAEKLFSSYFLFTAKWLNDLKNLLTKTHAPQHMQSNCPLNQALGYDIVEHKINPGPAE